MDTTNELQQSLLDTMDLISKKIADSTSAPLTIKAEIVEVIDEGLCQYSISYGGAIYKDAYAIGNAVYDPSTIVFVLVPDNDFDNPKMILNAVSPLASDYVDEELTDMDIPASDNLIPITDELNLSSWLDKEYDTIELEKTFNTAFGDYLNKYRRIKFSANIKTEIDVEHQSKGNYGLILRLPFLELDSSKKEGTNPTHKDFIIDVNNMLGDPYRYEVYQNVNVYFDIDDTLTYDTSNKDTTPQIIPFTKDFEYLEIPTDKNPDIHIKDISLEMIDVVSAEQSKGYYLSLVSDSGSYFLDNSRYATTKTLTPVLRINGKKTTYKAYDCYWFVEDASVDSTSEYWLSFGQSGWRCLNDRTNIQTDERGKKTFDYITNVYTWQVKPEDVLSKLRYKCVLRKSGISTNAAVIELKNLNKPIEISLTSKTGTNKYIENVGKVELVAKLFDPDNIGENRADKSYYVKWQRYDKNGNPQNSDFFTLDDEIFDRENNSYEVDISFPTYIIDKMGTISCSFYQTYQKIEKDKDPVMINQIIGTASITITTVSGVDYIVNIIGGNKLYKYDPDGDSPMEPTYDGPPSSFVKSCDPLTFKIFRSNGKEFTDNDYLYCSYIWKFPKKNTLLVLKNIFQRQDEDYYYIEGKGHDVVLQYSISKTYYKEKNNNTIFLSVKINDDDYIDTSTSITFTKDGMTGTNGSKYTALIKYDGYGYRQKDEDQNIIRKFQGIYIDDEKKWLRYDPGEKIGEKIGVPRNFVPAPTEKDTPFKVTVYRDTEEIDNIANYTVSWSLFDKAETTPFFALEVNESNPTQAKIRLGENYQWKEEDTIKCNIIQATVTIKEPSDTNADNTEEVLYVYYPIEITRVQDRSVIEPSETKKGDKCAAIIPTLEGGFEEVLYASDGSNPVWNKESNFTYIDNIYKNELELEYEWTQSNNLIQKAVDGKINGSQINISPVTKFEHNITNNYVKVKLKLTDKRREEIDDEINKTLKPKWNNKNEERKKQENITATLLDMIQKLGYNKTVEKNNNNEYEEVDIRTSYFNNCIDLLQYRYQLLTVLDSLIKEAESVVNRDYKSIGVDGKVPSTEQWRIDLNQIIKDIKEKYYNKIYLLNDLNDVQKITLTLSAKSINTNYYDIYSFINSLNRKINSYNKIVDKFLQWVKKDRSKVEKQLIAFKKLRNSLQLSVIYTMDDTEEHKGVLAYTNDIIFVNLKNNLLTYAEKFTKTDGGIISVNDIEKLLNDFKSLIDNYNINPHFDDITGKLNYTDFINIYSIKPLEELNNEIQGIEQRILELNAYLDKGSKFVHIRPILMHMNTTEMSYLRGWDGHKLYTDTKEVENATYLFAPQLGAGKMEDYTYEESGIQKSAKGFTGVIMGVKSFNSNNSSSNIGIFGWGKGIQTMFLNAKDGSAIFGKSGSGQVIIDPSLNLGLIYSSAYFSDVGFNSDGKPKSYSSVGKSTKGMLICLGGMVEELNEKGEKVWVEKTPFIHFGDNEGYIYSGKHNSLINKEDGFYLNQDGLSIGSKTYIDKTGTLRLGKGAASEKDPKYCWKISEGERNAYVRFPEQESKVEYSYIGYNANELFFTHDPIVYPTETVIHIMPNAKSNSVYIGTDGIRLGTKFAVDKDGYFYAKDGWLDGKIYATEGEIGGWTFDKKKIRSDITKGTYVTLEADGDIYNSNYIEHVSGWKLFSNGKASFMGNDSWFGSTHKKAEGTEYGIEGDGQLATPFIGNCKNHIKALAGEEFGGHKVRNVYSALNSDGSLPEGATYVGQVFI